MIRLRRAFTLIELLTVMAISTILFSLIAYPLFQSFNLTRAAQAFSTAQDIARVLTSKIAREVANAASVRNGAGLVPVALVNDNGVQNTSVNSNSIVIRLPDQSRTNTVDVVLPFAKLDLINPAEGDQSQYANGAFTNPVNGYIDPTLSSPKGQPVLPVAPGTTLVRYWIGRRNPFAEYNNPYDGILMQVTSARDNLYVLYRAEVTPFMLRTGQGTNGDTSVKYRPNLAFFQSDAATDTQIVDIDNPKFYEPNRTAGGVIISDNTESAPVRFSGSPLTQGDRIENWQAVAVNQMEVSRFDMILPVYDFRSHVAQFDANGVPRVLPLIQVRPERINSDPATAQVAVRQGQESDASSSAGSDVFLTQYGLWGGAIIRCFPQSWDPTNSNSNEYLVGLTGDNAGQAGAAPGFSIYGYNPATSTYDYLAEDMTELFDQYTYALLMSQKGAVQSNDQIYPFTAAVTAANNRDQLNSGSGWLNSTTWRQIFTPFTYDSQRGKVIASFGIDEVGNSNVAPTDPTLDNLPGAQTGLPVSPQADTTPMTGNFYDNTYSTINEKYNVIGAQFQSLLPTQVHRYIDLRVTPNSDGTPSPLDPRPQSNQATGFTYQTPDGGMRSKVQIVPGSEIVTGPDQLAGPHQGSPIRYTRISVGDPGPNQYKINYADLQEPVNPTTGLIDYSTAFPGTDVQPYLSSFNPRLYDSTNFVSAVLQPRYKAGYIQFDSDPNQPLGANTTGAPINVYYRFQFTGTRTGAAAKAGGATTDAFAVDYDTRQLMSVLLTVRDYAQSSLPNPQSVTLKATALVRNFTR